jgi:hypothetical protein
MRLTFTPRLRVVDFTEGLRRKQPGMELCWSSVVSWCADRGQTGVPAARGAAGLIGVWESVGSTWTGTVGTLDRAASGGAG